MHSNYKIQYDTRYQMCIRDSFCEVSVEQVYQMITCNEKLKALTEQVRSAEDIRCLLYTSSWTQAHTKLINAYLAEKMAVAEYKKVTSE